MDLGLTGRVAIVAAASKGLGRAAAEELSREGAHLAICARTASTLAETAAHIQKTTGHQVLHQALDVTDSEAVAAFVAAVEARFGRIDICVTNCGGPPSKSFKSTKPEDWRSAFDQLLMSTIFFARETLPRMQRNKWGRLITITSSAVKQPVDGLLLSNSIRAAVVGLARTLANEYAADGITVNNVCPGYTRTARLDGLASSISARTGCKAEEVFAGWEREIPAGRLGTPQEFAAVVAFLASERASYMNGASIAVTVVLSGACSSPQWPPPPVTLNSVCCPGASPFPGSPPIRPSLPGRPKVHSFPLRAPEMNFPLSANSLPSPSAFSPSAAGAS